MMETKKNKSVLSPVLALALMVGSGFILGWTMNTLSYSIGALGTVALVLTAVFIFIIGATWMSRMVNQSSTRNKYSGFNKGILFALLLIASGTLLLCMNAGILPVVWKSFFFSWPMLLFVIGIIEFCKFHFVSGIILAAVGKLFLFSRIALIYPDDLLYEQFLSTYWPVLIIIFGMLIFFSTLLKPKRRNSCWHSKGCRGDKDISYANENQGGKINYQFIFNGTEQVILDPVFNGGTIEIIFGGMELDLRRTSLPEGETYLHIKTVFGGVEIKVPEDWNIEVRSESFAGGVNDSRFSGIAPDQTKKLVLVAECVFGGVTIK